MRRLYKGFVALAVAAMVMFGGSMSVSAAGVRDVFDAEYYADTYQDLKEVFGYDEEALFAHYMLCGLSEGRCASPVFDVAKYRSSYEDLEQVFGDNWDAYVDHYFNFGIAEGRTAGVKTDASADRKQTPSESPASSQASAEQANVQASAEQDNAQASTEQEDAKASASQIYDILIAQKETFPEGMAWTNDNYVSWQGGTYNGGYGCAGFAFALSDAAFGNAPARIHTDYDNIRVGDILRVNHDTHSVIVLEVRESSVIVAEGNYNSRIHWGRELSKSSLPGEGNYIMTRYQ